MLAGGGVGGSYGTNNDTNPVEQSTARPQVIVKIGGADGIRTHDLLDAIEVVRPFLLSASSLNYAVTC